MKRTTRLTESQLVRLVKRVIREQSEKKVTIQGTQPANAPNWDLVHGILGYWCMGINIKCKV